MSQLRGRAWTRFQIEAEVDMFGEARIVNEHNALLYQMRRLHELLHKANAVFVPSNDESCKLNADALRESEPYIASA